MEMCARGDIWHMLTTEGVQGDHFVCVLVDEPVLRVWANIDGAVAGHVTDDTDAGHEH